MRVLMFGWEFPPFSMGGLGTACAGLTKGLVKQGVDVTFVLPRLPHQEDSHVRLVAAITSESSVIKYRPIKSLLLPYSTETQYSNAYKMHERLRPIEKIYGNNLYEEVFRFTRSSSRIAKSESFDIIHCHDWMTFLAGIYAKKISGKPLIVHVHATEFDRGGGGPVNKIVYDIEKKGMTYADKVIAVSNFTKRKIVANYGISPEKIIVIHNAVEQSGNEVIEDFPIRKEKKIVLFLGRITLQKGPDYFVMAAKKVLNKEPNTMFVVVGSGDMEHKMIELSAEQGISSAFLFAGHLSGPDIDRAYKMADVYVMPSVSEPFGITPLESMRNGTPVIISRQSGVSEVITHALKVDFWNTDDIADKIIAVLRYRGLKRELREQGKREVRRINWDIPAQKLMAAYSELVFRRS